jgi:hypothetical protein
MNSNQRRHKHVAPFLHGEWNMQVTYAIAMAAGRDAGNRSMRAAGCTAWSEEDYAVAAAVVARLLGCDHDGST